MILLMIQPNMYANNINARKKNNQDAARINKGLLDSTINSIQGFSFNFFHLLLFGPGGTSLVILFSYPIQVPQ